MNHMFKVVWNEALQAWLAVSELGAGGGKKSKGQKIRRGLQASGLTV